jgi:hypothetical protein
MGNLPNWIEYAVAKSFAIKYTNAAVIASAGVPILPPRINASNMWEIWNPMTGLYEPTTTKAIGINPNIGANQNWWIDGVDTGVRSFALQVEIQATADYIQWRYEGATTWTNLVALDSLKGDRVELRVVGNELEWKYASETAWTPLFDFTDVQISASILPYEVGGNYEEHQAFFDPTTGLLFIVLNNYLSVSIEQDLLDGNIMQIGGGVSETEMVEVTSPSTESLSGDAENQREINEEVVERFDEIETELEEIHDEIDSLIPRITIDDEPPPTVGGFNLEVW